MISYNETAILEDILNSVSKEDEDRLFVSLEYLKDFNGVVLGEIHDDFFGNVFSVWENVNKFENDTEELFCWSSFEEAKEKLETKGNPDKVMHLKEGLIVAFKHKMVLDDYTSETPDFVKKYNDALGLWHEYRKQFISKEDEQAKLREIGLAGIQALKKMNIDTK